jgi:soluble lytic murein transglycosylase-like protein
MNPREMVAKDPQATTAPRPSRYSKTLWIGLGLSAIILYSAGLLVAATYLSYKAPIRPDRYGHAFSRHLGDRLAAYALWLKSPSKAERATMPFEKINEILAATSARHGVDECLVYAVAVWESGLNPHAISSTGAVGLMALQPATARQFSLDDPFDPYANADAGTRLLGQLSHDYDGNLDLILAAYNGGSEAVGQFHGVPPYRETTDYVKHVGHIYRICKAER